MTSEERSSFYGVHRILPQSSGRAKQGRSCRAHGNRKKTL